MLLKQQGCGVGRAGCRNPFSRHIREHADDPARCIRRPHVSPRHRSSFRWRRGSPKAARSLASLLRGRFRACPPFPGHVKLRLRSRCNFRSRSSLAALYRDHAAFRLGGGTQTCTHADIRPAPARPLTGRRYEVSASAPVTLARGFTTTFAGIAINHVPGFVLAQLAGAAIGALVANLLFGREVAQQGHS